VHVIVYNFLTDHQDVLEGDDQDIKQQLGKAHPYLLSTFGYDAPVEVFIDSLNQQQLYSAFVGDIALTKTQLSDSSNPQLRTGDDYLAFLRSAVEFLSGVQVDDVTVRQAILAHDGDEKKAMLLAHNLQPTKSNLEALEAVLMASFEKSEGDDAPHIVQFKTIEPFNASAQSFAKIVQRANNVANIQTIHFQRGKHSAGTLIAKDPETHCALILKPGAGKQNPALGEKQNAASQGCREAAFYALAAACGLAEFLPECHLLIIDGIEYATMKFLHNAWQDGNTLKALDPNAARTILAPYLNNGMVHKWAVMDYVLGNPDRHSGNVMFCGNQVRLIDHGSALAGIDFQPPIDKHSFVPYYLRVFCPAGFGQLAADQKFKILPRVSEEIQSELVRFINMLHENIISALLLQYNIDPAPEVARLELLKFAVGIQPADLAINGVWTIG
jgi:hypothetical protein